MDVAPYKNADALVHVVRAFRDESVPHASGKVDPARDAQAMEDELILADLGVAERRLERLEKDLKKSATAELDKERDLMIALQRSARERARPLRALHLAGDDVKRLRGFQLLSAKPLLVVINLDERDVSAAGGRIERRRGAGRPDPVPVARGDARRGGLRARSSSKSRSSTQPTPRRSSPTSACTNRASIA